MGRQSRLVLAARSESRGHLQTRTCPGRFRNGGVAVVGLADFEIYLVCAKQRIHTCGQSKQKLMFSFDITHHNTTTGSSNMGRVRRYKKLKACDPCASGRGAAQREEDAKYDMAPSGLDSDEERCTCCSVKDREGEGTRGEGKREARRGDQCVAAWIPKSLPSSSSHGNPPAAHDPASTITKSSSITHQIMSSSTYIPCPLNCYPAFFPRSIFVHILLPRTQSTSPPSLHPPTHPPSLLNNKPHSRRHGRRAKATAARAAMGKRRPAGQ